jgi:pSer/pThr/pTyr-binding forkhead associated (FHA) protein
MGKLETRRIPLAGSQLNKNDFLAGNRALLIVISGPAAGTEYELDRPEMVIGRGGEAALSFKDDAMSRAHACFEVQQKGFKLRDLGSTNGIKINGGAVQAVDLKHGDRIECGEHVFQYVVEARRHSPKTHIIPEG